MDYTAAQEPCSKGRFAAQLAAWRTARKAARLQGVGRKAPSAMAPATARRSSVGETLGPQFTRGMSTPPVALIDESD